MFAKTCKFFKYLQEMMGDYDNSCKFFENLQEFIIFAAPKTKKI